jgi:hypothetical protein
MSTKHSRHEASPFVWDGRLSLAPVVAVCPEVEKLGFDPVLCRLTDSGLRESNGIDGLF